MLRAFRVILSLVITAAVLWAATLAVDDCPTGVYSSENCLWLSLSRRFHLPTSRLLKLGALEVVGLALLTALYLNFRYLCPLAPRRRSASSEVSRS